MTFNNKIRQPMITVDSPDTIRRLLKKLEEQRIRLSDKIAEEDKKVREAMLLRKSFPADPQYKKAHEQHIAKSDRYKRQYDEVARITYSLKLQLRSK